MMKNKKGASTALTMGVWLIAILLVGGVVGGGFYFATKAPVEGTALTTDDANDLSAGSCPEPTSDVVFVAKDLLAPGTTLSPTITVKDGDAGSATNGTQYAVGSDLEILWSVSGYEDAVSTHKVECGKNTIETQLLDVAAPTITIKNDADTATLTDDAAGGATNETVFAAGGTKTWEIQITGADKDGTGDILYVVELGSDTNVSTVTLSDKDGNNLNKVTVPSGLNVSGSNQFRTAFEIPNKNNAVRNKYYLTADATSGNLIIGAVYTTGYVQQSILDVDDNFKIGTVDEDGTVKFDTAWDYDFFVDGS